MNENFLIRVVDASGGSGTDGASIARTSTSGRLPRCAVGWNRSPPAATIAVATKMVARMRSDLTAADSDEGQGIDRVVCRIERRGHRRRHAAFRLRVPEVEVVRRFDTRAVLVVDDPHLRAIRIGGMDLPNNG